jgi:hypothetical protein
MTIAELRVAYAALLKNAVAALNADAIVQQAADANPYSRFLLPSAVVNHQPADPPYNEAQANQIVDDAMANMSDTDFMALLQGAVGFGLSLFPGV